MRLVVIAQYNGSGSVTLNTKAGVTNIQWFKDGVAISGATNISFTATLAGTYYASYDDINTICNDDRTIFFILLANGTSVTLDGSTNNSGFSNYQWKKGGVAISGANSVNYTTNEGGLYSLSYQGLNCTLTSENYYVFILNTPSSGTGNIDCSKTKISPMPVVGIPSQIDLVVTLNVTTAGLFSPTSFSGSGLSPANGVSIITFANTGIQVAHIPLLYNGSALAVFNFMVGSAGSCTADLSSTTAKKKVESEVWTLDNCIDKVVGPILK